ncbi:MCE family protein [Haloechinothrix sp. YIM 98757]|uniref:MCE family protein n=1 Tax=Haloechinothrix aidingensis TaxID=2752311 RepID=A0A838ADG5_9PSEU|nr:MlaD family protein [Haloechinothrix aidingensis]MBA0127339.1 MCE family protein [Haloechinothrix aidingensis]
MAGSRGLRQRLPAGQIALFLAIALACGVYIAVNAVGTDAVMAKDRVTVRMADGGGITPRVPVTYRGVTVGTVSDVRVARGDGVEVELAIRSNADVPADTEVVVAQDTPVALKHIDLRPSSHDPPYLSDGDELGPEDTSRPVPLETVLVNLMRLTDNIDTEDVAVIADELAAGLSGTAEELERLGDNSIELVDRFTELEPTASNLIDNTLRFLESSEGTAGRLPELTRTLAEATEQVRNQTPHGIELARSVPEVTDEVVPLLRELEPSVSVLLSNLITPVQIVSQRIPALQHGLVVIPDAFSQLASIADGDRANFEFVTTQGGTCYFPEERRTPTDTSEKEPNLGYHCPPDGPTVRGAANAPGPEAQRRTVVTTSDPNTGRTQVPGSDPIRMGSNGGQDDVLGEESWHAVYLQGVE